MKLTSKLLLIMLILCLPLINYVYSSFTVQINIRSQARIISSLGVYEDQNCTKPISNINWGELSPDSNTTITIYIRNAGTYASTLKMYTRNWYPTNAELYITLTWNMENATIYPNQTLQAMFTLTISSEVININEFGFEIIIVTEAI